MKLIHGDCLIEMQSIPDKSIDMILCDLPYGTTACKWDVVIPFDKLWEQYKRIIKDNGAIVLFGSEPFSSHLRMSNLKWYKYDWVWDKIKPNGFQHSKNRPMMKVEYVSIFSGAHMGHVSLLKGRRMNYNPQGVVPLGKKKVTSVAHGSTLGKRLNQIGKEYIAFTNFPHNLLSFSRDVDNFHPTQKPVALLEYLIKTYTSEGDLVLDNCMGSGSTGVACKNLNRKFIGIEKEKKYFEIARERIFGEIKTKKKGACA